MVTKLKLSKNKLLFLVLPFFLLAGCDDDPVPQAQAPVQQPQVVYVQPEQQQQPQVVYEQAPQQQAPVIVNQQPSGIGADHLVAGALGYMAGKSMSNNRGYDSNRTVVNKTIVNKTYVNQPQKTVSGSKSFYNSSVPKYNRNSVSSVRSYKSKPVKTYKRR